ncbi:MAG: 30S ribosomal protein S16 [Opitutaceae bacterium]|nr:30S ribosomal protein S16 [Cytophagales bacterium]
MASSSVKIRLSRRGRKKLALYDIVVANATSPRDGRFIEKLGTYNPNTNPATILFDEEKALKWLLNGAEPTDTVGRMLSYKGVLLRKHLQIGVIKGAITQEIADARYQDWTKSKQEKIEGKVSTLAQKAQDAKSAKFAAEKVANEAKAKIVASKRNAASADLEAAAVAAAKEAAGDTAEEVADESAVEEVKSEEVTAVAPEVTTETVVTEESEKAAE